MMRTVPGPTIVGHRVGVNYGAERLRFLAPVPAELPHHLIGFDDRPRDPLIEDVLRHRWRAHELPGQVARLDEAIEIALLTDHLVFEADPVSGIAAAQGDRPTAVGVEHTLD